MKTIIIFILLKIAEIAAVCLAYVLLSLLGRFLDTFLYDSGEVWYHPIYTGLGGSVAGFVACIVLVAYFGIPKWISSNWDWAKSLSKRK